MATYYSALARLAVIASIGACAMAAADQKLAIKPTLALKPPAVKLAALPNVAAPRSLTSQKLTAQLKAQGIQIERGPAPGTVQRFTVANLNRGTSALQLLQTSAVWSEGGVARASMEKNGYIVITFDAKAGTRYLMDLAITDHDGRTPRNPVWWMFGGSYGGIGFQDSVPVQDGHALFVFTSPRAGRTEIWLTSDDPTIFFSAELSVL